MIDSQEWEKELADISISFSATSDGDNVDSMPFSDWDGGSTYEEVKALIKDLLTTAREEERKKLIEQVREEFDVFLCCTSRCEHKGKGESELFLSAKKQIIESIEAKQKIINQNSNE
jgi:hypothetical protein